MAQLERFGNSAFECSNQPVRYPPGRPIPLAPSSFVGNLRELYEQHIVHVLPEIDEVAHQHRMLLKHCEGKDPVFLVRALTSNVRGETCVTTSGSRFCPSE
jgi:hypothetical protein